MWQARRHKGGRPYGNGASLIPSAIAMAVAALGVAAIGCRAMSWQAGLLSGLVFAVLPLTSRFGQEARSYALVTAFAVLASYLLLRAIEEPRHGGSGFPRRDRASPRASTGAALVVGIWALARRGRPAESVQPADHSGACRDRHGGAAPVAVFTWQQRGQLGWLETPQPGDLYALATMMTGSTASFVLIAMIALFAVPMQHAVRSPGGHGDDIRAAVPAQRLPAARG